MIIIDIETTGLDPVKHCMVSIGAVDYDADETYYAQCMVRAGSLIDPRALAVNGMTEEQCRYGHQTPEQAYQGFVEWARGRDTVLGGQQVGSFDVLFLHQYAGGKEAFERHFSRRMVDLHSVAWFKLGKSLSLDGILQAVGLDPEPKPHHALTGAKLEAEAFRRLLAKS